MMKYLLIFIFVLLLLFIYWTFTHVEQYEHIEQYENVNPKQIQAWVINLDKNTTKLNAFNNSYNSTDLVVLPIKRFPAILGSALDPTIYLTDFGLIEYTAVKKNGYRTKHHQLTSGAIGCFLSHYKLYELLLLDTANDFYLIFEDDIHIDTNAYEKIIKILENPPIDWDIILLGYHRLMVPRSDDSYFKFNAYWGMYAYIINKKGAQKMINNYDGKMDCQIDSFISWLSINNKINIYAVKMPFVYPDGSNYSDIQIIIKPINDIDAFMYKGFYLGD
jgi:GR25 family glycosyltransferase involved in LPS biosynthesis